MEKHDEEEEVILITGSYRVDSDIIAYYKSILEKQDQIIAKNDERRRSRPPKAAKM